MNLKQLTADTKIRSKKRQDKAILALFVLLGLDTLRRLLHRFNRDHVHRVKCWAQSLYTEAKYAQRLRVLRNRMRPEDFTQFVEEFGGSTLGKRIKDAAIKAVITAIITVVLHLENGWEAEIAAVLVMIVGKRIVRTFGPPLLRLMMSTYKRTIPALGYALRSTGSKTYTEAARAASNARMSIRPVHLPVAFAAVGACFILVMIGAIAIAYLNKEGDKYRTTEVAAVVEAPTGPARRTILPEVSNEALEVRQLGLNEYKGNQINVPSWVEPTELLVVHGDLAGNRRCGVAIVEPGEEVHLSKATWKAYLISGSTPEARVQEAMKVATDAIVYHGGNCPIVN